MDRTGLNFVGSDIDPRADPLSILYAAKRCAALIKRWRIDARHRQGIARVDRRTRRQEGVRKSWTAVIRQRSQHGIDRASRSADLIAAIIDDGRSGVIANQTKSRGKRPANVISH